MNTMILSINPGSTSTKVAVYQNEQELFCHTLTHSSEELAKFNGIWEQQNYRTQLVIDCLKQHDIHISELSAVVGRGGLLPPVKSGAYEVNKLMLKRLMSDKTISHASNLGAVIADYIAKLAGVKAYIYDSVAVDELREIAHYTGIPEIKRVCLSHALNSRAIAHRCAEDMGIAYQDATFIVAHMGGSISIALHYKGKMIDYLDNDEGPLGPETCGKISVKAILEFVDKTDMVYAKKRARGIGGIMGYLGTSDMRIAEKMAINGNQKAKQILSAMAYQISKGIAELAPVVYGEIDAIALTGGVAYSETITKEIKERVSFLAPVNIYPGEDEMKSLSLGIRRILLNQEIAREYIE